MYYRLTLVFTLLTNALFAQDSTRLSQLIAAEKLFDLQFTPAKRDSILSGLENNLRFYQYLHQHDLYNDVPLSLNFDPLLPGTSYDRQQRSISWNLPSEVSLPANRSELAFYSIPELASLLKRKKISSVELTRLFLERLKKYGPILHCVIELTEDSALAQAGRADADFAKGIYKSPLQGIPYGIKDLFAIKGTHTTWGTPPYKDQVIQQNAYVAERLARAGAVLVAKLSLGELAMDDVWFGGLTRNPWRLSTGSGGSSAGSASATVAGLVPLCHRHRNLWLHRRPIHALWRHRAAPHLRQHRPNRLYGPVLELRQSRPHLPQRRRRGLCLCVYPWR